MDGTAFAIQSLWEVSSLQGQVVGEKMPLRLADTHSGSGSVISASDFEFHFSLLTYLGDMGWRRHEKQP